MTVPITPPRPPDIDVPPRMTAVIDGITHVLPIVGCAVPNLAIISIPAKADKIPDNTYTVRRLPVYIDSNQFCRRLIPADRIQIASGTAYVSTRNIGPLQ